MTGPSADLMDELKTLRDFIRYAISAFTKADLHFGHGTVSALDEAVALVLHVLRLPHELPGGYFEANLTRQEKNDVLALIQRRIEERKPLAYLTHEAFFAGERFYVDERVLIPRSPIAELILSQFEPWIDADRVKRVLDLCTGSGCIALASALAFPEAEVDAVDVSPDALMVAEINRSRLGLCERVRLIQSDLYAALDSVRYDLIVSNPPYVSYEEWRQLPDEFHAEPRLGLESGEDGLDCVRRLLSGASQYLSETGILVVEVGSAAEALMAAYPEVPFSWLEFDHGGEGVFLLTADQLGAF